jgi:thymidylate synthase (FAD)
MPIHEQDLARFHPLTINISGGGFVRLVNVNGTDAAIDTIARAEFEETSPRMPDEVDSILSYMIRHTHTSPFEFVGMAFQVRCPMFVRSQWQRHRTGHYSEVSGRYRDVSELGAYAPPVDHLRKSAPSRKQGSSDEIVNDPDEVTRRCSEYYQAGQELYDYLVYDAGLSREVARGNLTQNNFTHYYFQLDLHNLLHLLRLRDHSTAQFQMTEYARALRHFVSVAFPITYRHFANHILNGVRFSADELEFLQIDETKLRQAEKKFSKGRLSELHEKVERVRAAIKH